MLSPALLTLCPERAPKLAEENGWPNDLDTLSDHEAFRAHVETSIESVVNQGLARYEQIKRFSLIPLDFSQDAGELTPTQKLKRNVIVERHQETIESMYPSA